MKNLVKYKNFNISPEILPFIKYMESVETNREKLSDLSKNWDSLSLLSQLGNAGVNMSKIKNNFTTLSSELINYLASELLKKTVAEISSKAQVAVDIVIRNLYERTADIGFLATDDKVRKFLMSNPTRYTENYLQECDEMRQRFREYVDKYSVYFDIVLMNKNGTILANINDEHQLIESHDPIIQEALTTSQEYVETYKYHDFIPEYEKSLVYSYRVTKTDAIDSETLGVLCLCFKFEDEMRGVFDNLVNPKTKECITLLDKDAMVIATSDENHIRSNAILETVLEEPYKIVSFGGRDYLAKSCKTKGYQGFFGLGWVGHIMVPLDYAFGDLEDNNFEITQELLLAILQNSKQFSNHLKKIPSQASSIQYNLNRAIWNGNINQSNSANGNKQFSRSLLQEIRKTGEQTKEIIGSSMASLTKTMVLGDSRFLADLILDIMDRNLYERANDCRWWALTPDFRSILENEKIESSERKKISNILSYINKLYTVYTNLFIYDKNGIVVAVSNQEEEHLIGRRLQEDWVKKSLSITDSSKYCVSDFAPSYLYDEKHTYIYNAPILSLQDESRVLGGIGIVFDAEVEFQGMIEETLPKQEDGRIKEGLFCVLATKEQMIIASNNPRYKTGDLLEIDKKFFALENGGSLSEIIAFDGNYYALGAQCSKGYREYKGKEDDYKNDVYSFVFSYISDVKETKITIEDKSIAQKEILTDTDANCIDIATFMIGSQWLGVKASDVVEAISCDELVSSVRMDTSHHFKGTILYKESVVSVIDIQNFIKEEQPDTYEEIVVLKFGDDGYIGILVNALGDIPEVETSRIKPLDAYVIGNGTLVQSVVFPKDPKSKEVLSILDIKKINANLVASNKTHMVAR